MSRVVLRKGGKLSLLRPHQNIKSRGRNVTSLAHLFLFDDCEIEAGVTLKDVFLLIRANIRQFDPILGNGCKDIVAEALSRRPRSKDSGDIEYLELYKTLHAGKKESHGLSRPDFHGIGFKLRKDRVDSFGNLLSKKGERIRWAISLTPTYKLAPLPVRLNTCLRVVDNNFKSKNWGKSLGEYGGITYTLGELLHGITWELTYHGPPAKRDQFGKELCDRAEKVRTGKAKTIPAAEVLKSLRKKWRRKKNGIR